MSEGYLRPMGGNPEYPFPVTVTLLCRPRCLSCQELLAELEPMRAGSAVRFQVIDLSDQEPPPFAQPFVVPATYVGDKLWRYGTYPLKELREHLRRETGRPSPAQLN